MPRVLSIVLLLLVFVPSARADLLLDEPFTGPTASVRMRVGGSFVPCLTASTDTAQTSVPGCAAGQPSIPAGGDAAGSGALRLTDNAHDRSGFAIYQHAFPFTHGLRLSFTTFAYNGTRVPGYGAADGISVFLADGAVAASRPGAFGGSLGYAQKSNDFDATVPDIAGVPGGYLGVGIDEFGNFANDREARGYGCAQRVDRDIHPNYVSLRGAGIAGSDWLRGYCLLDRAPAPGPLDAPDETSREAPGVARSFRLEIDPPSDPAAHVRLYAESGGAYVLVLDSPLPPDPPETFEFGIAASTGQGTNVHELRLLRLETIEPLPRWTLRKRHPRPLVAGAHGSFTLLAALAADGGSARDSVVLTDPLPDGLTVAALPHGDGWDCGATVVGSDQVRCGYAIERDGPLAPGTALPPLTVPVAVAPDATGRRVNVATLRGPELVEPVTAEDPFELDTRFDLRILKRASADRIAVGDPVAFTLVVVNDGPSDARDVTITDTLPAGLRFADAYDGPADCRRDGQQLRCELPLLRAGGAVQIVVDAVATEAGAGRALRNVAVVAADGDGDDANNRDDATVEVVGDDATPPPDTGEPRLEVEKRADAARVQVGQPLGYTIVVRNSGDATARDVVLTDTTTLAGTLRPLGDERADCTRLAPTVVRCRLGDLAAGASRTLRATVVHARAGRADNVASVTPAAGPLAGRVDVAGVTVSGGAALALVKRASRATMRVGEAVRYTLAVRSLGPLPAHRVRVCDTLAAPLRIVSAAPSGDARPRIAGRHVCWGLSRLAPGARRTFTLLAQARRPARAARDTAVADAADTRPARAARTVAIAPARAPAYTG